MQPGIESETVAGRQMLRQPCFGRRVDQRFDAPGLGIDLFGCLQRIAAVDKDRGLVGSSTMAMPAEPVKPVSQASRSSDGGDIFVLLLVGAGHHEAAQVASRQFLAKRGQTRGQRDAALRLIEGLEVRFKH